MALTIRNITKLNETPRTRGTRMQSPFKTRLVKSLKHARKQADSYRDDYLGSRYNPNVDPDYLENLKREWIRWGGVVIGIETAISLADLEGM